MVEETVDHHLYAVIGGELEYIHQQHYRDLETIKVAGFFNDKEEAKKVWRTNSQRDVDNAHMRWRVIKIY